LRNFLVEVLVAFDFIVEVLLVDVALVGGALVAVDGVGKLSFKELTAG